MRGGIFRLMFNIVEKFYSLNGEAPSTGKPVYIVRFTGCNLSCVYCDTEYKDEINISMTKQDLVCDIAKAVGAYPGVSVLFTGGEPLLGDRQFELMEVMRAFPAVEFFIETNGSVTINDFTVSNSRFVVDWKMPSSGFGDSFIMDNIDKMRPGVDCIKMVVSKDDLPGLIEKIDIIRKINKTLDIFISPQWGNIDFDKLAEFIIDNRLQVSLSLQIHKVIWGNKRGV